MKLNLKLMPNWLKKATNYYKEEKKMSNSDKIILVTGATGKQGGATANQLVKKGWKVRALVRNPSSEAAQQLAKQGVELTPGNLDDRASLDNAVNGVYGVFSVQNFWETGYDKEIAQSKTPTNTTK